MNLFRIFLFDKIPLHPASFSAFQILYITRCPHSTSVSLKPDRTTAQPNCCRRAYMHEWMYDCANTTCTECPLLQVFKNALVADRLWSGRSLVSRVGSVVRVSDSFHILNCAVVRAVARSVFRDTLPHSAFYSSSRIAVCIDTLIILLLQGIMHAKHTAQTWTS